MKLATLRTADGGTSAVLAVSADSYLPLPGADLADFLRNPQWRTLLEQVAASASDNDLIHAAETDLAPLLRPGKVICCGLNYSDHIREMGRDLPVYPTLFTKFADTLTGPLDTIEIRGSDGVDWEAELAVIVGSPLFQADDDEAHHAIAGYSVANDISMRDWQNRTLQWFQGKAFDASTPVGPVMVTADEAPARFEVRGYVNGELVQSGNTAALVFGPARLLSYISQFTQLRPGDVVLTGTPGGVGMGMTPPRFLSDGDVLKTEIDGIGRLENMIRIHPTTRAESRGPVPASSPQER